MADTFNSNLLKDDWKATGFIKPIAVWMNKVSKMLNGLHVRRGGQVEITKDFIAFRIDEFPWATVMFGCTIEDNSHIKVEAGLYILPTRHLRVLEKIVEVTGGSENDPHFVGMSWDGMGDEAQTPEISPNALALEPESDGKVHRIWLCEVYQEGGGIQIGRRGHFGPVIIGAVPIYGNLG